MSAIIWDDENRQFSVVEDQREFGAKLNAVGAHLKGNSRAYITGGASLAGAGIGSVMGAKKASKNAYNAAIAGGATEEEAKAAAKKARKKGALIGAALGAGAGASASEGSRLVKQEYGAVKGYLNSRKTTPGKSMKKMELAKLAAKNNIHLSGKKW